MKNSIEKFTKPDGRTKLQKEREEAYSLIIESYGRLSKNKIDYPTKNSAIRAVSDELTGKEHNGRILEIGVGMIWAALRNFECKNKTQSYRKIKRN